MSTKRIEALLGPYAGSHLDLPAGDADQAIADGWARDPYAPPSAKPAAIDTGKALAAAEKAIRKLRGETVDPEPPHAPTPAPKAQEPYRQRPAADAGKKDEPPPASKKPEDEPETGEAKSEAENRAMEAETGKSGYQTRATTTVTPATKRGRPPKK